MDAILEDWQKKAILKRFWDSGSPEHRRRIKFFVAETDAAGDPSYYGYVGNETNFCDTAPWYIMRQSGNSYRYFFGNIDFDRAWAIRVSLPYEHAYTFKGFHDRYDIR